VEAAPLGSAPRAASRPLRAASPSTPPSAAGAPSGASPASLPLLALLLSPLPLLPPLDVGLRGPRPSCSTFLDQS
jgi:hypothetical protein